MAKGNELRKRWTTPEGQNCAVRAVQALASGGCFEQLPWLRRHEGRWDIRGLPVSPLLGQVRLPAWRRAASFACGASALAGTRLLDADLSYANLEGITAGYCTFRNVAFDHATMRHGGMMGSRFLNCSFVGTDLFDARMHQAILGRENEFAQCVFERTNLGSSMHCAERYTQCTFVSIVGRRLDFVGARFDTCSFRGSLRDVLFQGHCWIKDNLPPGASPRFNRMPNRMRQVDFREAELRWVAFNGVDLTTCLFPTDANHLVVRRPGRAAVEVEAQMAREPDLEFAKAVQAWLSTFWLSEQDARTGRRDQPIDVVNRLDLREFMGQENGDHLYDVLVRLGETLRPGD